MIELIQDEYLKILVKALVYILTGAAGWGARALFKLHQDVMAAEDRLEICLPSWLMRYFGWAVLPLRVKRIEKSLGIANGGFTWRLVRTKRVNKCFSEIRKNGRDS